MQSLFFREAWVAVFFFCFFLEKSLDYTVTVYLKLIRVR